MLVTSIFSFSHNVFYSVLDRNYHFSKVLFAVCKCFQFGLVQKYLSFGKKLNMGAGGGVTLILSFASMD